jgi:tetratricopeptide (TPR) repeat protein
MLLLAACASTQNTGGASTKKPDSDEAAHAKMLEQGRAVLMQGGPKRAIAEYFDPVLKHYEDKYKDEQRKIYAARSSTESLFYMLQAATAKQSAVALDYVWSEAYFLKAYASVDLGDLTTAEALLHKALAMSPQNAAYLEELGQLYQTQNKWSEAIVQYKLAEEATHYSPEEVKKTDLARAWRGIGYILIEQGKLEEAEGYYHRCLKMNPADEKAKNELKYIEELRQKQRK